MTPILFPQPFRPPPPSIESITYNYMTTEELKEFMLNEQKVYIEKIFFNLEVMIIYLLARFIIGRSSGID
jgi:hypothetical protein